MASLYGLARSALFCLDAEHAHELTLSTFKNFPRLSTAPFASSRIDDPVTLMGLRFANRAGLAAGLDKNGDCLEAWSRLGFGFVEIGTVTPRPQPGNPRPRMFRLPRSRALINRLGFNNKGVDYLLARVRESDFRASGGVLGINIGKNFDTPNERAADDYLACLRKVHAAAGYITINISSPNTSALRELQNEEPLRKLLTLLVAEGRKLDDQQGRHVPLLVKVAPDLDDAQVAHIAVVARETGVDGLIATNTTVSRDGVEDEVRAAESGGLSGAPLRPRAETVLRALRWHLGKDFPLIGVGGIMTAADAGARIDAGADLVQIYTGFIYHGPQLVTECAQALGSKAVRAGSVMET
jgi:dihydroorotate dehydrogenase